MRERGFTDESRAKALETRRRNAEARRAARPAEVEPERLTPDELSALLARHATDERRRRSGHAPDPHGAHRDRGALLALARQLAAALKRICEEQGLDRCPLCGDPECPAPFLEVLHG